MYCYNPLCPAISTLCIELSLRRGEDVEFKSHERLNDVIAWTQRILSELLERNIDGEIFLGAPLSTLLIERYLDKEHSFIPFTTLLKDLRSPTQAIDLELYIKDVIRVARKIELRPLIAIYDPLWLRNTIEHYVIFALPTVGVFIENNALKKFNVVIRRYTDVEVLCLEVADYVYVQIGLWGFTDIMSYIRQIDNVYLEAILNDLIPPIEEVMKKFSVVRCYDVTLSIPHILLDNTDIDYEVENSRIVDDIERLWFLNKPNLLTIIGRPMIAPFMKFYGMDKDYAILWIPRPGVEFLKIVEHLIKNSENRMLSRIIYVVEPYGFYEQCLETSFSIPSTIVADILKDVMKPKHFDVVGLEYIDCRFRIYGDSTYMNAMYRSIKDYLSRLQ